MGVGYVRVLTALLAAITLHALLLSWSLPASKHLTISNGQMHVELIKSSRPLEAASKAAVQPTAVATPVLRHPGKVPKAHVKPVVRHTVVAVQQHRLPSKQPSRVVVKSTRTKVTAPAHQQTRPPGQVAHELAGSTNNPLRTGHSESAAPHKLSFMPASAQSMLLASIHYPRLARRHGWQGKGVFQLAIVSQSIRNITMLGSTGHAILDRAARLGLASVDHIPVVDGKYRLPVEFRLQ